MKFSLDSFLEAYCQSEFIVDEVEEEPGVTMSRSDVFWRTDSDTM
jgi:hypothetical protein